MKHYVRILLAVILIFGLSFPAMHAGAQGDAPPADPSTETETETETQPPSPAPTQPPTRPIVVIRSYYLDQDTIRPGESFTLHLQIRNVGGETAHNLIFAFSGDDFKPQETGGVVAVGELERDRDHDIGQRLLASTALWGKTNGTLSVQLSYNGPDGQAYTENFTITLDVLGWSGTWATATPTPTATAMPRAQVVVSSYQTDLELLEPGSIFTLNMNVRNLGSTDAQSVTMVLGGGATGSISPEGTPQPGGISGGSGELSVFAPLGSSNLQYLGDIPTGAEQAVNQKLIVNVSAEPGAYTLKISFIYSDSRGNRLVDDQIITLLVYQLPRVEVNFYRDPGAISAMQPNSLPLQVVNLGRKTAVLGNMTVTAENAELMNNVSLVGTLEAGGYFPLDVMYIPNEPGPAELKVLINYTDDFNQPRTIEQTIPIEVMESMMPEMPEPGMEIGPDGMPVGPGGVMDGGPAAPETFWQKVLRFLKGLIGLDSAPPQEMEPPMPMPGEGIPPGGLGSAPALRKAQG